MFKINTFSKKNNIYKTFYIFPKEVVNIKKLLLILVTEDFKYIMGNVPENYIEIGPHSYIKTPWCSNTIEILKRVEIDIERIEYSLHYNKSNIPHFDPMIYKIYNENEDFSTNKKINVKLIENITEFNIEKNLGLDNQDIKNYINLFENILKRKPTDVELFDLAQSNSEHSRHWFFNGKLICNNIELEKSLFYYIKKPLYENIKNSAIAFSDNSSAIYGNVEKLLFPINGKHESYYKVKDYSTLITFTAETHNFPTGISPFPGAATGTGGRIRDNIATGRGAYITAGTAGYCVGSLNDTILHKPEPKTILIEASNGASDYGNKIGEPIIQGFCRSFGMDIDGQRYEWIKPIMFTGGISHMFVNHLNKVPPKEGFIIVRIGGPAYPIGLGGGSASSRNQDDKNREQDFSAVQRGDPQMENKVYRVVRSCIELINNNPILSIHDQGAGGMGNVTKEIVSPLGANVDLNNVNVGNSNLSSMAIWCAEYQEQMTMLIHKKSKDVFNKICKRENCPVEFVGEVKNDGKITVKNKDEEVIDLPLNYVLEEVPRKTFNLTNKKLNLEEIIIPEISIIECLEKVFLLPQVGSKGFLVHKVDRSVTGLIVQQQCVGPFGLPISDYAAVSSSIFSDKGSVMAIGEQPIKSFISSKLMAEYTVSEMLSNIIWGGVESLSTIKCSGNWMWAPKVDGEGGHLIDAVKELSNILIKLEIALDGGKDSLSMCARKNNKNIIGPRTLVLSGYTTFNNYKKLITPYLKTTNSILINIPWTSGWPGLGASSLAQAFGKIGNKINEQLKWDTIKNSFKLINELINKQIILSGHDISDGGLITTIIEMSMAGNIGANLIIKNNFNSIEYLFSENPGLIIEVKNDVNVIKNITSYFAKYDIAYEYIGFTNTSKNFTIKHNNETILDEKLNKLRLLWSRQSLNMEKLQSTDFCVKQEEEYIINQVEEPYSIGKKIKINNTRLETKNTVFIIREEGSNGDREMASAFYYNDFNVVDCCMNDIINNPNIIDIANCLAFVGGFSFSDSCGAAKGWVKTILLNKKIKEAFERFRNDKKKISLGICNGCQLLCRLGWIENVEAPILNDSKKFESRWSTVKVRKTNNIFLKNCDDIQYGIWVAHAEGKFGRVPKNQIVMNYTLNTMKTTVYPYNPNGSFDGVAGVSSIDGRHLAMMPHPERCFLTKQCQYIPEYCSQDYSPWNNIFKNAYNWSIKNQIN